jgi:hypothetical protein
MTRRCLLVLLLVMACSKSNQSPNENKDGSAAATAPTEGEKKTTDKTAADVMKASIEEAKAKAAAQTPPTPPPAPPTPPADPIPPETPPAPPATPPADPIATEPADGSAAPAVMEFKVGDRVMAKWDNAKWYPGKIVGIKNGKYDVNYDDGDKSRGLSPTRVRKPGASTTTTSGGGAKSSGGGAKSSGGDAPCPGPGITRRCNGKCVNIQDDDNHCGGCNNRCPSGKHCDGHLFCRDADGNL